MAVFYLGQENVSLSKMHSGKFTKIIATIGPASDSPKDIEKMILSGVNIFRFNMKHNTPQWHLERIELVQKIADELKIQIGIMVDLQGPEIRVEIPKEGELSLVDNEEVLFTNLSKNKLNGNKKYIRIAHLAVLESLDVGDKFSIEDGYHEFVVTKKLNNEDVFAKIVNAGVIKHRKSLNLVGKDIDLPSLIHEDLNKLDMAAKTKVDFIALSFVRSRKDIDILNHELQKRNIEAKTVSKIESQKGIDNIDEIIDVSDAIMIARGDLGIETPIERIAYYQKLMIDKCRLLDKPVIVATQMLQSMISAPIPTRAEAADVANAVYDKTDCVMLSGETAIGDYPIKAVTTMRNILKFNESKADDDSFDPSVLDQTHSIVRACVEMLNHTKVDIGKVIVFTESGRSARALASYRVGVPIIAVSDNRKTIETLTISYGVIPHYTKFDPMKYNEPPRVIKELKEFGYLQDDEKVLVLHGRRWMDESNTNALAVLKV